MSPRYGALNRDCLKFICARLRQRSHSRGHRLSSSVESLSSQALPYFDMSIANLEKLNSGPIWA
jgi:hypothetical protein